MLFLCLGLLKHLSLSDLHQTLCGLLTVLLQWTPCLSWSQWPQTSVLQERQDFSSHSCKLSSFSLYPFIFIFHFLLLFPKPPSLLVHRNLPQILYFLGICCSSDTLVINFGYVLVVDVCVLFQIKSSEPFYWLGTSNAKFHCKCACLLSSLCQLTVLF